MSLCSQAFHSASLHSWQGLFAFSEDVTLEPIVKRLQIHEQQQDAVVMLKKGQTTRKVLRLILKLCVNSTSDTPGELPCCEY